MTHLFKFANVTHRAIEGSIEGWCIAEVLIFAMLSAVRIGLLHLRKTAALRSSNVRHKQSAFIQLRQISYINDFVAGNERFRNLIFHSHEDALLHSIEQGQHPKALFVGCSDSRVLPDIMLQVKPGDLFVCRTLGGFIPPYSPQVKLASVHAVIQYAVNILNVTDIIVCSHTFCGACAALYRDIEGPTEDIQHVRKWLELGKQAKTLAMKQLREDADPLIVHRLTEQLSALCQTENLLTHPYVKQRLDAGQLYVHAWHYEIETGDINYYDSKLKRFRQLRGKRLTDVQQQVHSKPNPTAMPELASAYGMENPIFHKAPADDTATTTTTTTK